MADDHPLPRAPRDIVVDNAELTTLMDRALNIVIEQLTHARDAIPHDEELKRCQYLTKIELLRAMVTTHLSIRILTSAQKCSGRKNEVSLLPDQKIDTLALARVQTERVFIALLLADKLGRWERAYRRDGYRALVARFVVEERLLGSDPRFKNHFRKDDMGDYIVHMDERAKDPNLSRDTTEQEIGQWVETTKQEKAFVFELPKCGNMEQHLQDPSFRQIAHRLYRTTDAYRDLCHFAHAGYGEIVLKSIARNSDRYSDWSNYEHDQVVRRGLLRSYVALLTTATLLVDRGDDAVVAALRAPWGYLREDVLGLFIWDEWAGAALTHDRWNGSRPS